MRRRRNSRRTNAGQRRPHQWQCEAAAGAAPPEWLRRRRSSASRMSADHPVAAQVNRDASLSCRAPDSGASDRRARAFPGGCSGNAVRQHVVRGAGRARRSLRHSKFGHDRSSCRSGSGYGRRRRETAGLIGPRGAQTGRRHVATPCRILPCIRVQHGVGHGVDARPPSGLAPCPTPCWTRMQGLVAASGHPRQAAPHRSQRHVVTYPAIEHMPRRQRFPAVVVISPIQALRARYTRVRAATDKQPRSRR